MATSSSNPPLQVKLCDICGDVGYEEMLAICTECTEGAEHVYCAQTLLDTVPPNWICECCKMKQTAGDTKQRGLHPDPYVLMQGSVLMDQLTRQTNLDERKVWPLSHLQIENSLFDRTGEFKTAGSSFSIKWAAENCVESPISKKQVVESICSPLQTANRSLSRPELSQENSFKCSKAKKVNFSSLSALPASPSGRNPSGNKASVQPQLAASVTPLRPSSGQLGHSELKGTLPLSSQTIVNGSNVSGNPALPSHQLSTSNAIPTSASLSRSSFATFDVSTKSSPGDEHGNTRNDLQDCIWSSPGFETSDGSIKCSQCKEVCHSGQDCASWRERVAKVTSGSRWIESKDDNSMRLQGRNTVTKVSQDQNTSDKIEYGHRFQDGNGNTTTPKQEACRVAKRLQSQNACNKYVVDQCFEVKDKDEEAQKKGIYSPGHAKRSLHSEETSGPCIKTELANLNNLRTCEKENNVCSSASATTSKHAIQQICVSKSSSFKEIGHERGYPVQSTKRRRLSHGRYSLQGSSIRQERGTVPVPAALHKGHTSFQMGDNGPWPMDTVRTNPSMNIQGEAAPWGHNTSQGITSVGEHEPGIGATLRIPRNCNIGSATLLPHNFPLPESPATPEPLFLWRGVIEISSYDNAIECYDGIQAHPSNRADPKVFQATKALPPRLCAEEVQRGVDSDSWPKSFQETPPASNSIGIFLFPDNVESYVTFYKPLHDRLASHDLTLRICLESSQLLIFSSSLLPKEEQCWNSKMYLWGVFLAKKERKTQTGVLDPSPVGEMLTNPVCQPSAVGESLANPVWQSSRAQMSETRPWNPMITVDIVGKLVDMDVDMECGRDETNSQEITTKADILDSEAGHLSPPHLPVSPLPLGSESVQPMPALTSLQSQQDASSGRSKPLSQVSKHRLSTLFDCNSNLQGTKHGLPTIPDGSKGKDYFLSEDIVENELDLPADIEPRCESGPLRSSRLPEQVLEHVPASSHKTSEVVPPLNGDILKELEETDLPPGFGFNTLKLHPPLSKSSCLGHVVQGPSHKQVDGHRTVLASNLAERSGFRLSKSSSLNYRDRWTCFNGGVTRSSFLSSGRNFKKTIDASWHSRRGFSYNKERNFYLNRNRDWRPRNWGRARDTKVKEDRERREEREWERRKFEGKGKIMGRIRMSHSSKDRYRYRDRHKKHVHKYTTPRSLSFLDSDLDSYFRSHSQSCSPSKRKEPFIVLSSQVFHGQGKHHPLAHFPSPSNSVESSKRLIGSASEIVANLDVEKACMQPEVDGTDMGTNVFQKVNSSSVTGSKRDRNQVGLVEEQKTVPAISPSSGNNVVDASLKLLEFSASVVLSDSVGKNNVLSSELMSYCTCSEMDTTDVHPNAPNAFKLSCSPIARARSISDSEVETPAKSFQGISSCDMGQSLTCLPLFPAREESEELDALETADGHHSGLHIAAQPCPCLEPLAFIQQLERPCHNLCHTSNFDHEAGPSRVGSSRNRPTPPSDFWSDCDSDVGPELTLANPFYRKGRNFWKKVENEHVLSSEEVGISLSLALGNSVN